MRDNVLATLINGSFTRSRTSSHEWSPALQEGETDAGDQQAVLDRIRQFVGDLTG